MSVAVRAPAALFVMSLAEQYFSEIAQSAEDRSLPSHAAAIIDAMVLDAVAAVGPVDEDDGPGAEVVAMTVALDAIEVLASTVGLGSPELLYRVLSQHLEHRPLASSQ